MGNRPVGVCGSRFPFRCHGNGSRKGLWLAQSVCAFSGFVARGRASLVWQRAALAEQVAGFGRHHSTLLNKTEEKTEKKRKV